MQIDYTLDRRIRKSHEEARDRRESESPIIRAWKRLKYMPADYDSEEELGKIRKAKDRAEKNDDWHRGATVEDPFDNVDLWRRPRVLYAGYVKMPQEPGDVGEESKSLAQSFRRASRRLDRWQDNLPGQAMARRLEREQERERGHPPAARSRKSSTAGNGVEPVEENGVRPHKPAIKREKTEPKRRPSAKKATSGRGQQIDVDPEPDDEDGGAELDEEDRDLLAEVDADEDGSEEEDEDMEE